MDKTLENLKAELANIQKEKNRTSDLEVATSLLIGVVERLAGHVKATATAAKSTGSAKAAAN